MYKCECGKAYLSSLALSNHKKSKHSNENYKYDDLSYDSLKKKRGRPKKNCQFKINDFAEISFELFFEHDLRKKIIRENFDIKKCFFQNYQEILELRLENLDFKFSNPYEYPLTMIILKKSEKETLSNFTCDYIFIKYLIECSNLTNEDYFNFLIKFIILFRECINKYKNIELENTILILNEKVPKEIREFTQFYDCEHVPELCNEFLTEFMEVNNFFGFNEEYINEMVPLIQHFCYWLYINNYTSSRLSLI